ncbi:MAG: tetratricopeptide repeat protein [Acidobacteriota bacterium]
MLIKHFRSITLMVALLVTLSLTSQTNAQQATLGSVDFPTSAKSPEAQKHFIRGVAALHSFWFEEALEAFRAATKIEPDFMMGYWGEAMAHNHPLWSEQDTESGRKVLTKLQDAKNLTDKERAFIGAARALYGEGDKLTRDKAYAAAMEKIYNDYPKDSEAAIFYSLSLLGTVRAGDKGYARQMKAGAIALEVYQKNPNHPGAAHFIIHAFDDPEHAILALPAAYRYAQIAPESSHARHMPSHIFVQLGMWDNVATSNESAWEASDVWVKRKNLPIYLRDYHSLHWLNYAYLEQGRYKKAEETMEVMRESMRKSNYENDMRPNYYENNYVTMSADLIVGTERWSDAKQIFDAMPKSTAKAATPAPASGEHAGHTMGSSDAKTVRPTAQRFRYLTTFINGLAAAAMNKTDEAERNAAELAEVAKLFNGQQAKSIEIMQLEVRAFAASMKGAHEQAIELMKRATALEEDMSPPSGPPSLIKPSHELYGEILLRANRPKEAAQAFSVALARQPNRVRSLIGAARAADQSGDTKAATTAYSKLLKIWSKADAGIKEVAEAQDYLKQAQGR